MTKPNLLPVLCAFGFSAALNASEVDVPNSFTSGTPALASEVNENFNAIETAVDDNHQKIDALQAEIDALEMENQNLQTEIETLRTAQPSAVAMPVFPRGAGPNFGDYGLDDGRGVFTIQFNVKVNPDTFVIGTNIFLSGAGGDGDGAVAWGDDFSTLIITTLEDFTTISPCFSGGLHLNIMGNGPLAPQDVHGKPIDGDRDGLPGGDFDITYDIVC